MARYILTKRVFNTLRGRGYKLVCKLCGLPFEIAKCPKCRSQDIVWVDKRIKEKFMCNGCGFSDEGCNLKGCIESKPSKYKRRKFYDCGCYDGSFFESDEVDEDDD